MTYNQFDIVTVPFPFTDSNTTKKRPAIIISNTLFNNSIHNSILAMITSAHNTSWAYDIAITNLTQSGLPNPSVIRIKLFTIDHRYIIKTIGTLSEQDRIRLKKTIKTIMI